MARKILLVLLALVVAAQASCKPKPPGVVAPPPPEPRSWPPEGTGEGLAWASPELPFLAPVADALHDLGWTLLTARPRPAGDDPTVWSTVVAATREHDVGAWIVVPPAAAGEADPAAWPVVLFRGAPPLPIAFLQLGPAAEDVAVLAQQPAPPDADETGALPGAWRIVDRPAGPTPELLWEALEPPEALAIVDLEGTGPADVVMTRWYDACPDPMLATAEPDCPAGTPREGCAAAPEDTGTPCLIVRAWLDGNGVPQTFRLLPRPDGGLSALGRPALDRVVALLQAASCPRLDLRTMAVRREAGLLDPAVAGELVEGLSCLSDPAVAEPRLEPLVALLDAPTDRALPRGVVVSLRAPEGAETGRWVDGYQLLPDLDGDGIRDWLWTERSDAGTRYVVTRGPGRGDVAGSFFVAANGDVVDRLIVAPPGGHATLASLDWRPAPEPAALLGVRLAPADGASRTEQIAVPLEFR